MNFVVNPSQKRQIIEAFAEVSEVGSPLKKLMSCQFTSDGKHIVYEGKAYLCETGENVPLNESWSLSDILHAGADLLSAGIDFVIPGSGAIVDVLNGLSYIIEAQFKSEQERDSLYLMSIITFAFVVLPGPLQTLAIPLKRAVKTGVGMTSKKVVKGLTIISKNLKRILNGITGPIRRAIKSPLAKTILGGGIVKNLGKLLSSFKSRIGKLMLPLTSKVSKVSSKVGLKRLTPKSLSSLKGFLKNVPKISQGKLLLRKMGFVAGKPYRYLGPSGKAMTGTIKSVSDDGVKVLFKDLKTGRTWSMAMSTQTFVKKAVGAPFTRRGAGVLVPLFTKRLADVILPDGTIDYNALNGMEDLDPDETSKESLDGMPEETTEYENKYDTVKVVTDFQNGLIKLGYDIKGGADGKYGTETLKTLKLFQNENDLTSSLGKMDRNSAKKISELLDKQNIPNSEDLKISLSKI